MYAKNGRVFRGLALFSVLLLRAATAQAVQSESRPETVGERPEAPNQSYREIETIFERQGVLTPRKRVVLDLSHQYSYSSSTRVALLGYTIIPAITVGLIDVRSVSRHTYIGALSGRYGITNRLELEAKFPYVVRDDLASAQPLATAAPDEVFNSYGNSLGDVEFGLRYQLNMPTAGGHIFIAGLRAKSDTGRGPFEVPVDPQTSLPTKLATGSGFWAVQPSLTVIFPSDPAVFFGSISYLYNIDRSFPDFGKVEPGNTIGANFGIGYALNEKASFSLGYEHAVVQKTRLRGTLLANARSTFLGSLLIGLSYRMAPNLNLNLSLSGGLTEDAPDVQITFRLPFSFGGVSRR